eukprot:gnl/TRDRNA2_/TRDRNA2_164907_c0_seq3.p1 gnl/TRDRNA2_/TRDRNA2_164907_c0~~gnl/TRDRNA2_/TRDRNA2_164907_c0_seq3.p1  ORF type:complete len:118 (-),score=7.24 gnl/TRDRNA2_/TRDRNA2_164907_c0_seq3:36-389(-)
MTDKVIANNGKRRSYPMVYKAPAAVTPESSVFSVSPPARTKLLPPLHQHTSKPLGGLHERLRLLIFQTQAIKILPVTLSRGQRLARIAPVKVLAVAGQLADRRQIHFRRDPRWQTVQ